MPLDRRVLGNMDIFLGWTGTASCEIAKVLKRAFGNFLGVKVFMSDIDLSLIGGSKSWKDGLDNALFRASYYFFIISPDSTSSEWMAYEAGAIHAISRQEREINTYVLLFGVEANKMPRCLDDYNAVRLDRDIWEGVFMKMCEDIKKLPGSSGILDNKKMDMQEWFRYFWNVIHSDVNSILENLKSEPQSQERDISDRGLDGTSAYPEKLNQLVENLTNFFDITLGMNGKLDQVLTHFLEFKTQITPTLREVGIIEDSNELDIAKIHGTTNQRLTSAIEYLNSVVDRIEKSGLQDQDTLEQLKATVNRFNNIMLS